MNLASLYRTEPHAVKTILPAKQLTADSEDFCRGALDCSAKIRNFEATATW